MGNTKHEKSFVDFDKPYEQNLIGLRGVVYFAIGLFLLVVITFGLMALLLNVLDDQATQTDNAERNPMQLKEKDRLPPGPRLQGAPGFGVETKDGYVNLELRNPQAEWEVIHEEYRKIWEDGRKGNDQTYTVLPVEEAKKKCGQNRIGNKKVVKMKKSSTVSAVLKLKLLIAVSLLIFGNTAQAQKSEHYNSPLYAPRTYDPSQTTSNGLPNALKEVGIE